MKKLKLLSLLILIFGSAFSQGPNFMSLPRTTTGNSWDYLLKVDSTLSPKDRRIKVSDFISAYGLGTLSGSGTLNYLPKWTPSGTVLGNSLVYDNGTNVGISTVTPIAKLEVNGTFKSATIYDNGTNVGIGTSTPNNLLQVSGLINFNNSSFNTYLGYQNGASSTSFAIRNSSVGYQSLFSNTDGAQNTAIGYQAMYANTDGEKNTAIGSLALAGNGSFNTAIGHSTLSSLTTGYNNTAIGQGAMNSITSGHDNIGIKGTGITTGNYNIQIGFNAVGTNLTTGSNNTIVGNNTLAGSASRSNSIILGYGAIGTLDNQIVFGQTATPVNKWKVAGVDWVMPSAQGGANTLLKNDGSGNLSWTTIASAGILTGSLTSGYIPVATGTTTTGNSFLSQSGNNVRMDAGKKLSSFNDATTLELNNSYSLLGTAASTLYLEDYLAQIQTSAYDLLSIATPSNNPALSSWDFFIGGGSRGTWTAAELTLKNTFKYTGSTPVSGGVLTSDASGNASWSSLSSLGAGTVTSVAQSFTGGLISVAGSPVTTSGSLDLTVAGTSGGVPYFSSSSTWASSSALAANAIVIGGGAGAAPSTTTTGTGVLTALGVNTGSAGAFVVNGGALGTPSSGTLTNCTGLPVSTGISGLGTGVATTLGTNLSITGGGTISLGGFTLTVPATGTVVEGTGTATRVPFWSNANTLTDDASMTYASSTLTTKQQVITGLASGAFALSVSGTATPVKIDASASNGTKIALSDAGTIRGYMGANSTYAWNVWDNAAGGILGGFQNGGTFIASKAIISGGSSYGLQVSSSGGTPMQVITSSTNGTKINLGENFASTPVSRGYIGASSTMAFNVWDNGAGGILGGFLNTGEFIVGGSSAITGATLLNVVKSTNGGTEAGVSNTNGGSSAYAGFSLNNASQSSYLLMNGTGATGGTLNGIASMLCLQNSHANGVAIAANGASGGLHFYSGGSAAANERMRILSTGPVLLNATSATAAAGRLEVTTEDAASGLVHSNGTIIYQTQLTNGAGAYAGTYSNHDFYLHTNNGVGRLRVATTGNINVRNKLYVGDISTTPTALLHIAASSTATSSGQIKFASGTPMTTPEAGSFGEFDGTHIFFTPSTTRYQVAQVLIGSATLDFPSTSAQSSADLTITVTGAADGDPVTVGPVNASTLTNSAFTAWVSATNTVTVRFNNYSSGAQDPASGTFKVTVNKN